MTVARLRSEMSHREFVDWMAFDSWRDQEERKQAFRRRARGR